MPIAKGMYRIIDIQAIDNDWFSVEIELTENEGWFPIGGIFSSGILSGEIYDNTTVMQIKIHKDSFVTSTALVAFRTKHQNIYYNYEVLRHYNASTSGGEMGLVNAVITKLSTNTIQRKQITEYYSPFEFVHNQDYYMEIETKAFVIKDLKFFEDLLRSASVVIAATDESTFYPGEISDNPDVIGISGSTADIVQQPYFGGLQDNIWYRAQLELGDIKYQNGSYKGKLKFKIKG